MKGIKGAEGRRKGLEKKERGERKALGGLRRMPGAGSREHSACAAKRIFSCASRAGAHLGDRDTDPILYHARV